MKFFPVFSLQLSHSYYRDGRCLDFAIEPTAETQRLLKNHRCVLKTAPNGLRVLIGGSEQHVPLIALQKGEVFSFHLRLQNPAFALFTDLSEITRKPAPVFTNTEAGAARSSQLSLVSRKSPLAAGVFADVEIGVTDSLLDTAAGPVEFSLVFTAKQTRWAYYCVTDLSGASAQLQIVDAEGPPVVFSDANRIHLNQQPDLTDAVAVALGARYPEKQRIRFVSDKLIPCQQAARKRLQLQLGGTRLAESLPNPSLQHYSTIAGAGGQTAQPQNVLFHVIKYFTHTFVTTRS
jgi:hypothetical protein